MESLFPIAVKNKLNEFSLTVEVKIPSYLRVGSCRVLLQQHGSFFSIESESNKRESLLNAEVSKKSNTISISPKESPKKMAPPSVMGSPLRFKRLQGSFRREAKLTVPKIDKTPKSSELLESLDLHRPPPTHNHTLDSNPFNTLPNKKHMPLKTANSSTSRLPSTTNSNTGSKPPSTVNSSTSRLPSAANTNTGNRPPSTANSSTSRLPSTTNSNTSSNTSTRQSVYKKYDALSTPSKFLSRLVTATTNRPQLFAEKNIVSQSSQTTETRFMDSLNLEQHNKENDVSFGKRYSVGVRSCESDTISDIVDFDEVDRVSVKSDPGSTTDDATGGSSIPTGTSVKSDTSIKSDSPNIIPHHISSVSSFSSSVGLFSIKRKKKVGPQASLPAVKQLVPRPRVPSISSPTGALKVRRQPPGKKEVKTVFLLRYTGGEGAKEGYYRELTVDLSYVIRPSLIFEDFAISPVKG